MATRCRHGCAALLPQRPLGAARLAAARVGRLWIQRLVIVGLPRLAVGIPLMRVKPGIHRWAVRRRIDRWCAELSQLERAADPAQAQVQAQLRRLDAPESCLVRLRVPAAFGAEAYMLREHARWVRDRLRERAAPR